MSIRALQDEYKARGIGKAVSYSTLRTLTIDGRTVRVVNERPSDLAAQANADQDTYSLARVLASEGYGGDKGTGLAAALVAIAQATQNSARGKTITALVTRSKYPEADGSYGSQIGRRVSSSKDPTTYHLMVARMVLDGKVPDLAHGASSFLDLAVQNMGKQDGNAIRTGEAIIEKWHHEGMAYAGPIPSVDSYHLMLFRTESSAATRELAKMAALEVNNEGQSGRNYPAPGDPDGKNTGLVAVVLGGAAKLLGVG